MCYVFMYVMCYMLCAEVLYADELCADVLYDDVLCVRQIGKRPSVHVFTYGMFYGMCYLLRVMCADVLYVRQIGKRPSGNRRSINLCLAAADTSCA